MTKKIAIVGGGGRESALVDAYSKSKNVGEILAFPGNDLMQINTDKPITTFPDIKTTDVDEIVEACLKESVFLVDVAQENAIAAGLVDRLSEVGIIAVGPAKPSGRIEWDKSWARKVGEEIGLPQPLIKVCRSSGEAQEFLESQPDQAWFVKASGLAEGKGVLPAKNNKHALERVKEMQRFGSSGETFLIESCLVGEEFSMFALCDGKDFKIVGSAQDHKRVNNNDQGENTGGMGCSAPPLVVTNEILQDVKENIVNKTIQYMNKTGLPYKGILYFGGMVVDKNKTYVIEFNSRWGDPEAQIILPSIKNDFFDISMAIIERTLGDMHIEVDTKARVVIAGVSRGYPEDFSKVIGKQVYGLQEAHDIEGVRVYGAGVKVKDGKHYANGGRLFYIVGEGENVIEARQKAYSAMSIISVEGNNLHYRTDIGWNDVRRHRQNES